MHVGRHHGSRQGLAPRPFVVRGVPAGGILGITAVGGVPLLVFLYHSAGWFGADAALQDAVELPCQLGANGGETE